MKPRHALFCCLLLGLSAGTARAQSAVQLVEDVGASEQRGYISVTLVFGCTLRYVSHTPASNGDAVQLRLSAGPDCGSPGDEIARPLTVGASDYIRSIDVVRPFGSDVELRIGWSRAEQFVVVPSFDGHGLRIRLLRPESDRGKVTVRDVTGSASTYAVNLDSSRDPFDAEAVAAAARETGVHTYVSELTVDEQKWYRLRAGPFVTEADARRVLLAARTRYPHSWLAISDDEALTAIGTPGAVTSVPAVVVPGNATLTTPDVEKTLKQAHDAFRHKDYAKAIPLLTRLLEQPEFPQRAEALELMALSHERSGQLAHAKAEYEDYLRRYPQGDGADRVRKRLRALALATRPGRSGQGLADDESAWKFYGGYSQIYRQDSSTFKSQDVSTDVTTQNALINDVGIVARRRGERFDFSTRVAAGYTYDMLQDGPGDQSRVTAMFAELTDRDLDWSVRAGRQSGSARGLLGGFDGVHGSWQVRPRLRLNADFGYPVESSRDGPDTDRRFVGLSADFGTFANAWDFSVYAVSQEYFGATDRQALGTEVRFYKPGLTFVGMLDYDIHYTELNDVLLLGTIALPARWTVSFNLDHRKSPSLTTRNAMIGQPVKSFDELFGMFTDSEIEQLARDRTASSDTYTVSLSRPFGEKWHWSMDLASMSVGSTPASGGVEATPSSGTELALSTQMLGYGLFGRGDVSSFGFQYQTGSTTDTLALGISSQFPIGQNWRIGPRLRVDRRRFDVDNSTQLTYTPSLRAEFRVRRFTVEAESGAEIGSRDLGSTSQDTSRYYVSLGYRYDF